VVAYCTLAIVATKASQGPATQLPFVNVQVITQAYDVLTDGEQEGSCVGAQPAGCVNSAGACTSNSMASTQLSTCNNLPTQYCTAMQQSAACCCSSVTVCVWCC
jgi:hypothetical protein